MSVGLFASLIYYSLACTSGRCGTHVLTAGSGYVFFFFFLFFGLKNLCLRGKSSNPLTTTRKPFTVFLGSQHCQTFHSGSQSGDILSTIGYDSIIQHLNNGRKNCKEFEEFLKERAAIEEKYGKDLLNLSRKKPCGQSEIHTLKRALEVFKQQVDNVAQCHIQLAQTLREEARKMEEFREKQKLQRKKTEVIMDAVHKQKSLQFKKTMDAKRNYEQKCRDKDEAEQAVHRSANLVNPKQQEKLFVKLATSKTAVEDSDKAYMLHINTLDKVREEWQSEHIKACEMYEQVRKSLEMCSIEKDIEYFVNQRKTGQTPPAPIMYENFYSPKNAVAPGKATGPNIARRGPLPIPKSLPDDPDYSVVSDYSLIYQ
ncbi:proline-serine-threonine phosphatase-interacting protein 2 isoform X2 [Oryctolagus cuniculus]|uniref:proline-serine-threonine phosphatase-interacting protein 2 isoform X2 n=1 Tax=Oryctolagus cuniculus TaxID=9986 RepID=UPI00222ECDE5|nr:proline-serine-threonine phosphatase-interacting protein 2 isoform X2 [Oryctolagus cuniculus]